MFHFASPHDYGSSTELGGSYNHMLCVADPGSAVDQLRWLPKREWYRRNRDAP